MNEKQYFEIVGIINKAIDNCEANIKIAKTTNDFEFEHRNQYAAEVLRGLLDEVYSIRG